MLTTGADGAAPVTPVDVQRYEVRLELDLERKLVTGRTTLLYRLARADVRELALPHYGVHVDSVSTPNGPAPHRLVEGQLLVELPARPAGEDRRLDIAYSGKPERGLVFAEGVAYSDFDTCGWMFCREEPGDRATLLLELVVPEGMQSVASGRLLNNRPSDAKRSVHVWQQDAAYPAYTFGFAVGNFARAQETVDGKELVYLGPASSETEQLLRRKFADTRLALGYFTGVAGVAMPVPVYTQVLVPGAVGQEKSSFSLLGKSWLDPILTEPTEDWLLVHELAHQWWGNWITCRDWQHFWLNEGLVTFLQATYKEQRWGRPAYDRELRLAREGWSWAKETWRDVPLTYAGKYPSLGIRRAIVYSKAALFLDQLREIMGTAFWTGLSTYTQRHGGSSVVSRDFQLAMEEALGRSLAPLFDEWVYETKPVP